MPPNLELQAGVVATILLAVLALYVYFDRKIADLVKANVEIERKFQNSLEATAKEFDDAAKELAKQIAETRHLLRNENQGAIGTHQAEVSESLRRLECRINELNQTLVSVQLEFATRTTAIEAGLGIVTFNVPPRGPRGGV
jgi:hypothetical protein